MGIKVKGHTRTKGGKKHHVMAHERNGRKSGGKYNVGAGKGFMERTDDGKIASEKSNTTSPFEPKDKTAGGGEKGREGKWMMHSEKGKAVK